MSLCWLRRKSLLFKITPEYNASSMLVRSKIEDIGSTGNDNDNNGGSILDIWSNILDPYPSSPDRFGEEDSFDSSISRIMQPKSVHKDWEVADFYDSSLLEERSLCASPLLLEYSSCDILMSKEGFLLSADEVSLEDNRYRTDSNNMSHRHCYTPMYSTSASPFNSSEGSTPYPTGTDHPRKLTVIAESDDDPLFRQHVDLLFEFTKSPHERHDSSSTFESRLHKEHQFYNTRPRVEGTDMFPSSACHSFRLPTGVPMNLPILRGSFDQPSHMSVPPVYQAKYGVRPVDSFVPLTSEDAARQRYLPWLRNVNFRRGGSAATPRAALAPQETSGTEERVSGCSSGCSSSSYTTRSLQRNEESSTEFTQRAPKSPPDDTDDSEYAEEDAGDSDSDEWSNSKSFKRKKPRTRSASSGTKRSKCTGDSTTGIYPLRPSQPHSYTHSLCTHRTWPRE